MFASVLCLLEEVDMWAIRSFDFLACHHLPPVNSSPILSLKAVLIPIPGLCCKIVGLTEMVGDWRWEPLSCASNPLDVGGHGKLRFGEANKFGDLQNRRVEAVFPK